MTEEVHIVVANMRARADQCRRLAQSIGNEGARSLLLRMADEIERDIQRLEERES